MSEPSLPPSSSPLLPNPTPITGSSESLPAQPQARRKKNLPKKAASRTRAGYLEVLAMRRLAHSLPRPHAIPLPTTSNPTPSLPTTLEAFPPLPSPSAPIAASPMETSISYKPLPKREQPIDTDGFQTVQRKRGRKGNPPTDTPNPTPTTTSNPFTPLASLKKTSKDDPPAIILSRASYAPHAVAEHLKKHGITNFKILPTLRELRILPQDLPTHKTILSLFQSPQENIPFHTYAPKGTKRNKKFLILGLDLTQPLDEVREALDHEDLISVVRMTRTNPEGQKTPIPPILATFKPHYNYTAHLKKIIAINHIVIKTKEYTQTHDIPQCHRCQQFGHTKGYCNLPPKCVRCAGSHLVSECQRASNALNCANCGEEHPASYKACKHRQELIQKVQARRKPLPVSYVPAPLPTHNPWSVPRQPAPFPAQEPSPQQPAQPHPTTHTLPPNPTPPAQPSDSTPAWVSRIESVVSNLVETVNNLIKLVMHQMTK